jgi:NAD(P)-dependent dehydrogenase (short-subunit alcohol dehydrogenase family)
VKLAGQVALVTGASRGLGEAIAEALVIEGASVAIAARDPDTLRQVATRLASQRPAADQQVVEHPTDVSSPREVRQLVAATHSRFGRIDVLVCNAGIYGPIGPSEDAEWQDWTRTIEVNLYGTVLCCREVVPIMRRQRRGKIVALSGGGATRGLPRFSAYAASKAGVVRFAETLALELAGQGIDVNSVAPGALNTRLLDEVLAAGPQRAGDDMYGQALRQQQGGGTPLITAAELVVFLASAESDGISGRLLSAVWDDWQALPSVKEKLAGSDVYTLRRITPTDRGW